MIFFKTYTYLYKFLRWFEIGLGLLFITSAILKVVEINRFCVQIYAYGVIQQKELLPWIATITILTEISLGFLFLISFPYKRFTLGINLLMLHIFTFLILYGWIFNDLKDCGCFGKIEMGPVESIIKNIILILISITCFLFVKPSETRLHIKNNLIKYYLPLLLILTVTLLFSIHQLRSEQIDTRKTTNLETSPYKEMKIEIDGITYDLGKGEYLIALLSFSCDHCVEEAPKINEYTIIENLPQIIALCLEESPGEKEEFIQKVQPLFPIYSLGNKVRLFLSLIGKEPPRLVYLKEGRIVKYWDYDLPEPEELVEEISEIR